MELQETKRKKFYPHSSGKYKQTFTFQSVKEDIKKKIQRTFIEGLDIVILLQKEEYIDLQAMKPTRQLSEETNANTRRTEQEGFDMEYKSDYEEWKKRMRIFESNKSKEIGRASCRER